MLTLSLSLAIVCFIVYFLKVIMGASFFLSFSLFPLLT